MVRLKTAWHSLRYDCLAILFAVLAALCTAAVMPFVHYPLYAFFYAAVALSAWCGGTRPGIVATVSAYILLNYFWSPPLYSFELQGIGVIIRLMVFVLVSLLIGSLNANLKTAKHKLEKNLQVLEKSEERYRAITENVPQLIWFAGADGTVEYFNQRWYDYTGLASGDCLGWKWQQVIHPEDLPLVLEHWTIVLKRGQLLELESRLKGKDGNYRWYITRALPMLDADGAVQFWFGTSTDIDEQKKIQQSLYEQEQERTQLLLELEIQRKRLEALLEQMPAGLIIADVSGKLLLGNPQVEQIWRHSFLPAEDIEQYEVYKGFHADGRPYSPHEWPLARSVSRGEVVVNEEINFLRGDGTQGVMLVNSTPIRDSQGQITAGLVTFLDVTEQKQAQEALRESEERFRQMAETIEDVFWVSTNTPEDYRILYVSPAYAQIWGNSCESLYEKPYTWIESIHPEDQQRVRNEFLTRSLSNHLDLEFRIVRPDGSIRWVRDRSFPVLDANGNAYRKVGVAEDITDRKQTEIALRETQALFESFMQQIPGCAFIKDEQGKYVYVNAVGANIVGLEIAEVLGKTDFELVPASVAQKLRESDRAILDGNQPVELLEIVPQGGQEHHFITYKFPFVDTAGRRFLAGMSFDITENKRLETALNKSEERFRLAAQAVDGIVYDWDLQTGFVYRSEGLYRILGVHPEDVPQTDTWWSERVHPDDMARFAPVVDSMINGDDDRYSVEYRVRHEDGHWVYVWDQGYMIRDQQKKLVRVVGSTADISDRKRAEAEKIELLEREQIARTKAEEANRIKDEFLAVLSHELRSPLNPILGWSKLLRSRKFDQSTLNNALETIERNAKLQTKLIDDLLDVSRILRGKLTLNRQSVNLVPTIAEALETVRLAAQAKSLQIRSLVDDVGTVLGDAARLQQVVWNLLSNAVKFTPSGGTIVIRLTKVDSYAQIQVTDTGIGIESKFLPYIFDYFRQADSSITRNFGGLGLGLAIVRHLVELHGGTIVAASPGEGQGATFTVQLPLWHHQDSEKLSTRDNNLPAARLADVRILTVDDDADTRDYISCALAQAGAEVIVATSAVEVLKIVSQSQIDILLADIGMPDIDGYTLIRQIRKLPPARGGNIKAIALTAYTRESDQQQAIAAGFQHHISKPVDPFELAQIIAKLLGRE